MGGPIEYDINQADVGTVLDFGISTRERGTTIDAIVFSLDPFLIEDDLDALLEGQAPGGVTGDFNNDGQLTGVDIDLLTTESAAGNNPPAYDLNSDALVDADDVGVWINDLFKSWIGDANLDGEFSSADLVTVLASGTYEAEVDSAWTTGDFNGDGRTNSGDLVAALADGGYEVGPRAAVSAVPEPVSVTLLTLGIVGLCGRRKRSERNPVGPGILPANG